MRKAVLRVWAGGLLLAFGVLGVFSTCQGETWQLKFMPEVPKASEADGKKYPQSHFFRGSAQYFNTSFSSQQKQVDPAKDPQLKEFFGVVKKEPTYVSKNPLRGLVKFGDQRFAFAMDTVPKKEPKEKPKEKAASEEKSAEKSDDKADSEEKDAAKKELTKAEKKKAEQKKQIAAMQKSAFNRLYLDLNANGDLTDDEPIKAESIRAYSSNFARSAFVATLPVEQDGEKFDVPCNFEANINSWSHSLKTPDGKEKKIEQKHYYARFYSSCFREGEIKLGDKAFRVILIDYNNNGVFDDTSELHEVNMWQGEGKPSRKENHVQLGDIIYIFPAETTGRPRFAYPSRPGGKGEVNSLSVGDLVGAIDGQFWNMKVTPLGDELTLTPSTEAVGFVENAGKQFTLQAFNKDQKAYMSLASDETGKAPLPPGEWVLTGYSMTFKKEEPKAEEPEDAEKAKSEKTAQEKAIEKVVEKMANFLIGNKKAAKATEATVMARLPGTDASNIKVVAKETTELKFGGPYKVTVNSNVRQQGKGKYTAQLSLDLVGATGESCQDVRLGNGRPPKPTFVISTKDGTEVESGAFDYG